MKKVRNKKKVERAMKSVERGAEGSGDRRTELEKRMEGKAKAEKHEDIHDEEAGDVSQYDVLEHNRERVHRLKTFINHYHR